MAEQYIETPVQFQNNEMMMTMIAGNYPKKIQNISRASLDWISLTQVTYCSKFKVQLEMPRKIYEFSFSTRLDQESDSC